MLKGMSKLPIHSKPVSQVMKSRKSDLQDLFHKMYEINRLKRNILPLLDDNLRSYVDISYDFKETLILIVAGDAISTRLRFQTPELLQRFKSHPSLNTIKKIHIKVQSYKHNKKTKAHSADSKPVSLLSEENAKTVHSIADTINHPALKTVMQRIAKRIKRDA